MFELLFPFDRRWQREVTVQSKFSRKIMSPLKFPQWHPLSFAWLTQAFEIQSMPKLHMYEVGAPIILRDLIARSRQGKQSILAFADSICVAALAVTVDTARSGQRNADNEQTKSFLRMCLVSKQRPINPQGDLKARNFVPLRIPRVSPLGLHRHRKGITRDYTKILLSSSNDTPYLQIRAPCR